MQKTRHEVELEAVRLLAEHFDQENTLEEAIATLGLVRLALDTADEMGMPYGVVLTAAHDISRQQGV